MSARQLQCQDKDLKETTLHLQRMRLERKKRHDEKHSICVKKLAVGQVVLLHNTRRKKNMSQKLPFRWLEPYQITDAVKEKGTYMLKELDGLRLAGIFAGDRLKRFHPRQRLYLDHVPVLDLEELPNLDNFLLSNGDSDLSDVPNDISDL